MRTHPIRIWDPSGIAAVSAFVFVLGMLVGSPAVLAASGGLIVLAAASAAVASLMRRLQVLPQPAVRVGRRR